MNIPDNIEAEGRWPHDHLFIDQDGIPTQPLKVVGPEGFEPSAFGFLRSRNSSSPGGSVKPVVISGAQRHSH